MKDPMQRLFEEWFVEKLIRAGYKATVNPEAYEKIKQTSEKERPPYKYHGVTIEESGRTTKLKKCPFCGGEAELLECTSGWYVDCKDDCIRLAYDTKEEAIEAWNRRVEE